MPLVVASNAKISFEVVFTAPAASSYPADIIVAIEERGGGTYNISIPVTGTGEAASAGSPPPTSALTGSASSLTFGSELVGTSTSQAITLTNSGTASVTISQAAVSGSGFALSGFSGAVTLAASKSLPLTVSFTPTAIGSVTGSLSVLSNATNSSVSIPLSGTGVQPQISVTPASVSFTNVSVGATNTQSVTIKNSGTANLTVSQASLAGSSFSMSGMSTPMSIAPGGSSTITLGFTPASASSFYANLSLVNNSPTSPLVVPLSGTSVASVLKLSASPTSLNFGSLATGTNSTQSITLTNSGNSSISISNVAVSGTGFSHTSIALPVTLTAGQSTSFGVEFAPASAGSLTGTATVTSTASNSPLSIALTGTGAAATSYSVALNWAPGTTSITGYNIYRGSASGGPYSKLNPSLLTSTSYSDTSVTAGQTYYYVATEENSAGQESSYSNQVTLSIP
jgi:hypothetical protein